MTGRAFALPLVLLAACGDVQPRIVELRGETMGTTYTVKYVARLERSEVAAHGAAVRDEVERVLQHVNAVASTYLADSEISRFNAHSAGVPFRASPELLGVLLPALRLARLTGGAFDPTVMPLVRVRGFGPGRTPGDEDSAAVAAALELVGYEKLSVDGAVLTKARDGVELDLSSCAKGWGVDAVCQWLRAAGHGDHMVEIGGEVRCAGRKPGGEPWRIGIEAPGGSGRERVVRRAVELVDEAVATSGDYRIFVESGGVRRHHILDARTGENAPGKVVSVSVFATDCRTADMLATALMLVGPERGRGLLAEFTGAAPRAMVLRRGDDGAVVEIELR